MNKKLNKNTYILGGLGLAAIGALGICAYSKCAKNPKCEQLTVSDLISKEDGHYTNVLDTYGLQNEHTVQFSEVELITLPTAPKIEELETGENYIDVNGRLIDFNVNIPKFFNTLADSPVKLVMTGETVHAAFGTQKEEV